MTYPRGFTYGGSTGGSRAPSTGTPLVAPRYTGSTGGSSQPIGSRQSQPVNPITSYRWQGVSLTPAQQQALQNHYGASATVTGGGGGAANEGPEGPDLEQMQADEEEAAIRALRAKYRSAITGLRTDRDLLDLGQEAGAAASRRQEDQALNAALNSFAGRGTARSGFALQRQAGIATEAGAARAAALAQYRAERGHIQQQIRQGLPEQRAAEQAERLLAIRKAYAMHELNKPTS